MNEWGGRKFSLPDEGEYSSLSDGGIGYRLRCDMIDRARTAREGVNPRHPKNNQKDVQPICRATTLESLICVMGATPAESEIHRTVGRPCENEYVVFRPHAGELPPGGATGDEAVRRLRDHDLPPDHTRSVKPDRPRADAGR